MKDIPSDLAGRLAADTTTLAHVFIVRRRDGVVFGFTDHDRALVVDGVSCDPDSGFDRTSASRSAGLAVGEEEIAGAFTSDRITADDLLAGLWDGADVAVHRVDWTEPSVGVVLRRGTLGEVTTRDGSFRAELRGPAAPAERPRGRTFSRSCDAEFGDARCGVDVATLERPAVAAAGSDSRTVILDALSGRPTDWFAGGRVVIGSGPLSGTGAVIEDHLLDGFGERLVLRHPLSAALAAGTALVLTPGCDKLFATCRDRFLNHENFRGCPHMPGQDFVFSYASSNRGGVIFS